MSVFIHPTAIVEEGAELGEGTKAWHHVHVQAGAKIGAGCTLGKDVFVAAKAVLGDRVKVQNGVSLYDGVTLEEDVFVGPHAVFTNVKNPRAFISRRSELLPTLVRRGATIGAGAVIVCGHTVGEYAFVAAGAVVTKDVAPHALVAGNPARRIGWMSRAGHRLEGRGIVECPETKERYRIDAEGCRPAADGEEVQEVVKLQDLQAEARYFEADLRKAFDRVLASGAFIMGEEVTKLERELEQELGCAHAITVSSGTDALLVALMALGVGPGDEVITTPFSFFATVAVILRLGAKPVFADIDPDTLNIDPARVREAVTPRTKAILPVHLFGRPVDAQIFDDARALGIPVVEDAAQAFGAPKVGTLGALGCFSFFPTKNLGALGDAGLVTTEDAGLAERVRVLRTQGAKAKYHHVLVGGNFRMDAMQAAFLRAKLPKHREMTARRRENARAYDEGFAELEARGVLRRPVPAEGHVYHHYVVQAARREELREALKRGGVETAVYYPEPLHVMPALGEVAAGVSMPNAERACREALAVPVHPWVRAVAVMRRITHRSEAGNLPASE